MPLRISFPVDTPPAGRGWWHDAIDLKERRSHENETEDQSIQPTGRARDALRRGFGVWEVTFETRAAIFKHEQGALYVACLLLDPPPEPLHAVALALKAKHMGGHADGDFVVIQQRNLGLDDAEAVRALWNRQRALERVMEDDEEIEPVKAEALRELEAITEFLRKNPWRSRGGAERCVRAVAIAIKRLHAHLAGAVDVEGQPHPVFMPLPNTYESTC